jgi:integrase
MEKTTYPGVYTREKTSKATGKQEKIFYVSYYSPDRKRKLEKVGSSLEGMTAAKANIFRTRRIEGKDLSNTEKRLETKRKKQQEEDRWTFGKLWDSYLNYKGDYKTFQTDFGFYSKHLKDGFGGREPSEIIPLDIDRLKRNLSKKKNLKPQTVKHILNILVRLSNYGKKKALCPGFSFTVELPSVDNIKTEDLTTEQLRNLWDVIEAEENTQVKNFMKMVLYTGMRRGELFRLQWNDINFEKGFILIRDPKGGKDQKIPLNQSVHALLLDHERPFQDSPYIFPGKNGSERKDIKRQVNRIKKAAGLPKDFRPLHGLRHVFASMLASGGQVDMYTLQKLLTHKSPQMTQRYAHLRDETLKAAAEVASDAIGEITVSRANKKKSQK